MEWLHLRNTCLIPRVNLTVRTSSVSDPAHEYEIIAGHDLAAVIHVTRFRGLPIVVILKTFTRPTAENVSVAGLATAACARHRAPFALYAGYNPRLRRTGIPVPVRLRPSPLNLIVKPLVADVPTPKLVPSCLEFLDFDAY